MVIDKEREVYENYYANAYRGVYRFGDRVSRELELVREKVASFIGAASPEEIFFSSGTTMGMNLVANAWGRKFLQPDDEVLLTLANIMPTSFPGNGSRDTPVPSFALHHSWKTDR